MFSQSILLGFLGEDAVLSFSQSGQPRLNFSIATNEKWKTKEGEAREKTTWHRCVTFGKRAESLAPHMIKGTLILVIGSTKVNQWEDQEGIKRTSSSVVVNTIKLVSNKKSDKTTDVNDEFPPDMESEEDYQPDDSDSDIT
jgi:single-strand DNA-binding protein